MFVYIHLLQLQILLRYISFRTSFVVCALNDTYAGIPFQISMYHILLATWLLKGKLAGTQFKLAEKDTDQFRKNTCSWEYELKRLFFF